MPRRPGVVLVAHRYEGESAEYLRALAGGVGAPARVACIAHRTYEEIVAGATELRDGGCDAILIVPLMVTAASSLAREVAALALRLAAQLELAVIMVPALDDAPEVVEVLSDRATELARDPRAQAVVLVGHGPTLDEDVAAWERLGIRLAGGVRDRGHFAAARALVVRDDAPAEVRAAAVHAARERVARYLADTGQPVIVVPWVVGAGQLTRTRLAEDFADLGVRYDGRPLLPHSALENWITRELALASMALPRAQPGAVVSLWER